jgi:hypothetical protein
MGQSGAVPLTQAGMASDRLRGASPREVPGLLSPRSLPRRTCIEPEIPDTANRYAVGRYICYDTHAVFFSVLLPVGPLQNSAHSQKEGAPLAKTNHQYEKRRKEIEKKKKQEEKKRLKLLRKDQPEESAEDAAAFLAELRGYDADDDDSDAENDEDENES